MERQPLRVKLVQQGIWAMELESMPLAAGYLKATALQNERLAREASIEIKNFDGAATLWSMANELFRDDAPDVLGFSVLGWNYRQFAALSETYKQVRPDGWVIFGGNHVSHQADRVMKMFPFVDIVVNGEGEFTFSELMLARLDGQSRHDLGHIDGISFQDERGALVTTSDRPRIDNLDLIASPFLTGAIPMVNEAGKFRYDVALLETNRGCPYKCAFCYWGGAVGQRVRTFSRERLRQELEMFAHHRVHTLVLCDANFGMLPSDAAFVHDVIEMKERYGFPRSIETSWAKNKSATFYEIVKLMRDSGLHSSFTLALQTLDSDTLDLMDRRNMKVNDWEKLVEWMNNEGLDCYAELIWGAPGETVESFMKGYDRLASHVSRVAVYPMLILPNTTYYESKKRYGLVTVRGNADDFEHVLSHDTMSPQDNEFMHRFIFAARLLAENLYFRWIWRPLLEFSGLSQSDIIRSFLDWCEHTESPGVEPIRAGIRNSFSNSEVLAPVIDYMYGTDEGKDAMRLWWKEAIEPRVPASMLWLATQVFEYEMLTLPAYSCSGRKPSSRYPSERLPQVQIDGAAYYVWQDLSFGCDVPELVAAMKRGGQTESALRPATVSMYYKVGANNFFPSTNHEEITYYMGRPEKELPGAGMKRL